VEQPSNRKEGKASSANASTQNRGEQSKEPYVSDHSAYFRRGAITFSRTYCDGAATKGQDFAKVIAKMIDD
jgi:hypothetical protein